MASKTLIRTGSSLVNRLMSKPFLHQKTSSTSPIISSQSHGLDITPKLFPSLSNFHSPLHLHQNDADSMRKVANEGFVYPSGLPSLRFFLPEGDLIFHSLWYLLRPPFVSRENLKEKDYHFFFVTFWIMPLFWYRLYLYKHFDPIKEKRKEIILFNWQILSFHACGTCITYFFRDPIFIWL